MLSDSTQPLIIGINANVADGKDTSWLYDIDFSPFGDREVVVVGERRYDIAVRLSYGGVSHRVVDTYGEAINSFEEQYATDPWYIHLYRTGNAYHGVHPFYMWYWGAHALDHLGAVIILGGDPKVAKRLGFMAASTMNDALEMASHYVGSSPTLTHLHTPPLFMSEVE